MTYSLVITAETMFTINIRAILIMARCQCLQCYCGWLYRSMISRCFFVCLFCFFPEEIITVLFIFLFMKTKRLWIFIHLKHRTLNWISPKMLTHRCLATLTKSMVRSCYWNVYYNTAHTLWTAYYYYTTVQHIKFYVFICSMWSLFSL